MEYVFYIRFARGEQLEVDKTHNVCELPEAINIFTNGEVDDDDLMLKRNDAFGVCVCILRGTREDCEQASTLQYQVDLPGVIDIFVRRCREPNVPQLLENEQIKQNLTSYSNNIFNCYPYDHFAENRFMEFRQIVNHLFLEPQLAANRRYRIRRPEFEGVEGFGNIASDSDSEPENVITENNI